jgi:Zn-dependent membrane protease YugP
VVAVHFPVESTIVEQLCFDEEHNRIACAVQGWLAVKIAATGVGSHPVGNGSKVNADYEVGRIRNDASVKGENMQIVFVISMLGAVSSRFRECSELACLPIPMTGIGRQ